MARSYGVLKISVWEPQSDFRTLTLHAQWAYAMLISQPQISNLGVLPHTPEKWRRFARGLTATELQEALDELEQARYTIVDEDTGELLVRTFIKHDAVWKVPKLVTNARKLIREVESEGIRGYLIERHPWLVQEWAKEQIDAHETARDTPSDTRTDRGIDTPSDTPIGEAAQIPLPEGVSKGVTEPLSPRAPARGPGLGAGGTSSSRPSKDEALDVDAARANSQQESGSAAAATRAEAPTQTEIDQALATLHATDKGSFARIAPLAEQLPHDVFNQVVKRVHDRKSTGSVKNDVGLLVDLLRTTVRAVEYAAASEAAARREAMTPAHEVTATARGYAINHHPWDVVQELLERRIARLTPSEADRGELLGIARDAYDQAADPEPTVSTTAE